MFFTVYLTCFALHLFFEGIIATGNSSEVDYIQRNKRVVGGKSISNLFKSVVKIEIQNPTNEEYNFFCNGFLFDHDFKKSKTKIPHRETSEKSYFYYFDQSSCNDMESDEDPISSVNQVLTSSFCFGDALKDMNESDKICKRLRVVFKLTLEKTFNSTRIISRLFEVTGTSEISNEFQKQFPPLEKEGESSMGSSPTPKEGQLVVLFLDSSDPLPTLRISKLTTGRERCFVAGWGYASMNEKNWTPGEVKFLETTVLTIEDCKKEIISHGILTESVFCGKNDYPNGPAFNDVGAPLICYSRPGKYFVVGVLERIVPPYVIVNSKSVAIGIYKDISKYLDIIKKLQNLL